MTPYFLYFVIAIAGRFFITNKTGKEKFQATCPPGSVVLSCGISNTQDTWEDRSRYAFPVSSNACECQSFSEIQCVAYCGPAQALGYEIKTEIFQVNGQVSCSAGKKVVSCSMKNTARKFSTEAFKKFAPSDDGTSCLCYDNLEGVCGAVCVSLPTEHEIIPNFGVGNVLAECPAGKTVLGCGVMSKHQNPPEEKPSYSVSMPNSCLCSSTSGVTCYALCFKDVVSSAGASPVVGILKNFTF